MNELQVIVEQKPGEIRWNYEELKKELAEQLKTFKEIVYTDDTIDEAKKDRAALRKLSKSVNDRKIEIKKKCLEPFAVIEEQAKELIALIQEPIDVIDERVNTYEINRRMKRKEKIMAEMKNAFKDLPDDIRVKLEEKTFDPRWLNVTATDKMYRDATKKAHDEVVDALHVLANVDEDFADEVMAVYMKDLNLTAAMMKAQELQRQKEKVLERERLRREQEQVLRESMAQGGNLAQTTAPEPHPTNPPHIDEQRPSPSISRIENDGMEIPSSRTEEKTPEERFHGWNIVFHGTDEQLQKVLGYIKFVGADYELR